MQQGLSLSRISLRSLPFFFFCFLRVQVYMCFLISKRYMESCDHRSHLAQGTHWADALAQAYSITVLKLLSQKLPGLEPLSFQAGV